MAKSQNDLVAAAQTLARLQAKREKIVARQAAQLIKVDEDIHSVMTWLREEVAAD